MEWHIMNILLLQGYFSPVAVKYAFDHQDKVNDLILLNPPVRFSEVNNLFIFWSIWFSLMSNLTSERVLLVSKF